jgi:Asp-tRNA(Asn)/Glu-tRNA(Gln) amidotransferase C subunit
MLFKQYKNGSCDIEFSDEEIKIILKNSKLHLSDEALKNFGNNLMKIIVEWQSNFKEDIKNKPTFKNTEIKGE